MSSITGPTGFRSRSPVSRGCLRAPEPGKGTLLMTVATSELESLVRREHSDPHSVLGAHPQDGGVVVRAFRPSAAAITVLVAGRKAPVEMTQIHPGGVFEAVIDGAELPLRYQLEVDYGDAGKFTIDDPYAFLPTIGELDQYLISEGRHEELYNRLGAHVREMGFPPPAPGPPVTGTAFAVWAPAARAVSVVGDFNSWDGRLHPMRSLGSTGVWELFLPAIGPGARYKYEILTQDHQILLKADPYALRTEVPPKTASVVSRSEHTWSAADGDWLAVRAQETPALERPVSIYEVHLGSWRLNSLEGNRSLTYVELADELCAYVKDMGFTHVELLPVMAHPFKGSWGYQVTGYYAPTPFYGSPDDFREVVDRLHQHGLGVILDWVPAHFPRDEFGLARFDGTALYEHADPRRGEHPDWGTLVFNYGRHEVRNFLISNSLFWLREYHTDGIRVDAVASMLYLDYSRNAGEWVPNQFGGREDLDAVSFLKEFNEVIYGREPGALMIAEESTSWPAVSRPTYVGGLGFDLKWNMGWMNDTLRFIELDPLFRQHHHGELTFSMLYAFHENFILPLSHDEVVHGKRTLLEKMPGDDWQKFANLRLLFGYMFAHPGKKLLFMGSELAERNEFWEEGSVDWSLEESPSHRGVQRLVTDLNRLHATERPFFEVDFEWAGFEWIDANDAAASILSFIRRARNPEDYVVVVCNFTPVLRLDYRVGVPGPGFYREILNSDSAYYEGRDAGNSGGVRAEPIPGHDRPWSIKLKVPPLAAIYFKPQRD